MPDAPWLLCRKNWSNRPSSTGMSVALYRWMRMPLGRAMDGQDFISWYSYGLLGSDGLLQ